jgi:hypothetical protein
MLQYYKHYITTPSTTTFIPFEKCQQRLFGLVKFSIENKDKNVNLIQGSTVAGLGQVDEIIF